MMDDQTENIQQISAFNLDLIKALSSGLMDEHAENSRWMMATLVSTNGASLISIVSTDRVNSFAKYSSAAFFGGGIILGILSGFFSIIYLRWLIGHFARQGAFWSKIAISGIYDPDVEIPDLSKMNLGLSGLLLITSPAILSFFALICGIVQTVLNLK